MDEVWTTWLITYETDTFKGKETRTQLFSFNSENPTINGIKKFFKTTDVILFMQRLDDK